MKLNNFKKSDTLVSLFVDSEIIKNESSLNNCLYSIAKQTHGVDLVVLYSDLTSDDISLLEQYIKSPKLTSTIVGEDGQTSLETLNLEDGQYLNCQAIKVDASNFPSVFNIGFNYASANEYEYYSIIEGEDVVSASWFEYSNTYFNEDSSIAITLPLIRNVINGVFNGVINEAAWVEGLAEEAGITDINLLLRYNIINILGAVFKVSDVKENSEQKENGLYYPIKESIKLTHTYEFFLRMIYNDLKIKTIPRICYEFKFISKPKYVYTSVKVPNNIATISKDNGGIDQREIQFYVDLAKKEYFFDKDRNVLFNS